MNGLDLFSGIGGLTCALAPWVRPIAYCEHDKYAQSVLLSRMRTGDIDCAPIWDDVRTLRGSDLRGAIDIVYGGFPCQDISVAGRGAGLGGERSGLYSEIERIVGEAKPTFVFLENVPAIRTRGLGRVVWGLASLGYDLRWTVISAASVGAPHKRERWFCLASNSNRKLVGNELRRWIGTSGKGATVIKNYGSKESLAHAEGIGLETQQNGCLRKQETIAKPGASGHWRKSWWSTEPDVGRVVNGLPMRVDRIKCLGNSVVPLQAREAFKKLSGIECMK